ncbi:MAG: galactokinase [Oscillospiraceae bacterium]|jgi:galactokinase|nr:galactokinase [Oscillospiraceae bacterium]MCI1989836.1 galactokinase [Oscillospiraceae bacterium]MCI2034939.1 galactokinase [Oscillospiraceae bacterium]
MTPNLAKEKILRGDCAETLARLYACGEKEAAAKGERIAGALEEFETLFGADRDVRIFSAPGRTEIGGNHTDHQGGRVLAAGVDLDAVAVASRAEGGEIRVKSRGFPEDALNAGDLARKPEEEGGSKAIIRGICKGFADRGYKIGGFHAYTTSNVLAGSGLSSSAAFEVLIGTAVNGLFCRNEVPPLAVAQIGQYAENEYFGKPCGLMDQAASAIGGFALIDFSDAENPRAEKIPFDFSKCGCRLCMVDTKGSHSDLTPDYAAIPAEMKQAAACFGKKLLSQVDEAEFYSRIPAVRAAAGDRAVLRAMHFFSENARVLKEAAALKAGDFKAFKRLVLESGRSSFQYLQNVYSPSHVAEQGVSVALALCERLLADRGGAWRVHGGGFAGTVQAYVPNAFLAEFTREMEAVFGKGSCRPLAVRPVGGAAIL